VLCFTPDPGAVIAEVARVLKPGARFALLDYANYEAFTMAPASEAVERVIQATGQSVRLRGGDFSVGRVVPALMHAAGLEVEYLEPIVRIARPGTALWNWPASFFRNYLPTLVELGLISDVERHAFEVVWRERSENPDAYLITPTMVGVVGVKR
jgi:SAM-dependent methyltransferase